MINNIEMRMRKLKKQKPVVLRLPPGQLTSDRLHQAFRRSPDGDGCGDWGGRGGTRDWRGKDEIRTV